MVIDMSELSRRLLVALVGKDRCTAKDTGMTQAELQAAVRDLGRMTDDDNHPVSIVHTYHRGDEITALELTPSGRGLAAHAAR